MGHHWAGAAPGPVRAKVARKAPKPDGTAVQNKPAPGEHLLDQMLRQLAPSVAASFTDEQRRVLKSLLDSRRATRHPLDIRRAFSLGRNRYYMVFLLGRERRLGKPAQQDSVSTGLFGLLGYLVLALGVLGTLFAFVYHLR